MPDVQAARELAASLTEEWTPALAAAGVKFKLRWTREWGLSGLTEGLVLLVMPGGGVDHVHFERMRKRPWRGEWVDIVPLADVAQRLRGRLADYAEGADS